MKNIFRLAHGKSTRNLCSWLPPFLALAVALSLALAATHAHAAGEFTAMPECGELLTALQTVDAQTPVKAAPGHPGRFLDRLDADLVKLSRLPLSARARTTVVRAVERIQRIELVSFLHPRVGTHHPYFMELTAIDEVLEESLLAPGLAELPPGLALLRERLLRELDQEMARSFVALGAKIEPLLADSARGVLLRNPNACLGRNDTTLDKYLAEHPEAAARISTAGDDAAGGAN